MHISLTFLFFFVKLSHAFLFLHRPTNELTNAIHLFFFFFLFLLRLHLSFPFLSLSSVFIAPSPFHLHPLHLASFCSPISLSLSLSPLTLYLQFTRPFFVPFNCCAHNIIHSRTYPTPLLASALIPLHLFLSLSYFFSLALCFLPYFFYSLHYTHTRSLPLSQSRSSSLILPFLLFFLSFPPFFFLYLSLYLLFRYFLFPFHSQLLPKQFAVGTLSTTKPLFNYTTYEGPSRRIRQQQH